MTSMTRKWGQSCYTWIGCGHAETQTSRLSGFNGQTAVTERRIQEHQPNLPEEGLEELDQTAEDQGVPSDG